MASTSDVPLRRGEAGETAHAEGLPLAEASQPAFVAERRPSLVPPGGSFGSFRGETQPALARSKSVDVLDDDSPIFQQQLWLAKLLHEEALRETTDTASDTTTEVDEREETPAHKVEGGGLPRLELDGSHRRNRNEWASGWERWRRWHCCCSRCPSQERVARQHSRPSFRGAARTASSGSER
jgi:hypothetical protein